MNIKVPTHNRVPSLRRPRSRVRRSSYQTGRPSVNKNLESVGPMGCIRGDANTIYKRYRLYMKERSAHNDIIRNENLRQYAEHYCRLIEAEQQEQSKREIEKQQEKQKGAPPLPKKLSQDLPLPTPSLHISNDTTNEIPLHEVPDNSIRHNLEKPLEQPHLLPTE